MKITEIVAKLRDEEPKLVKGFPEKRVIKILRSVLEHIADEIDKTDEGKVVVPGLGSFTVRKATRQTNEGEVEAKRIVLKRIKSKATQTE